LVKKIGNAIGCRLQGLGFLHEKYVEQINISHGLNSNITSIFLKYFLVDFISLVIHLNATCGKIIDTSQFLFTCKYVWKYEPLIKVDNGIFICASSVWNWIIFRVFSCMCKELHGMWLIISLSYGKWITKVIAHLSIPNSDANIMLPTNLQKVCRILWSLLLMQHILSSKPLDWEINCIFVGRSHRKGVKWKVLKSFLFYVSSFVLTHNAWQVFHFKPWEASNVTKISECRMLWVHRLECVPALKIINLPLLIYHHINFKFNWFLHLQV
jgi:hypothetical protein